MYHKSRGVVLQTIKYGETSVIARIYTDIHGLTSFIIKGARSNSKSQKAPMLQKGTLLEIDYSYQSNKQLHYLKEIKRAYTYQSIPFDTAKSALMLFMIELVSATTIEHESNIEQFEYIFEQLVLLDEIKPTPLFHLQFAVNLTRFLGFYPDENFSTSNTIFDLRQGSFLPQHYQGANCMSVIESALLATLCNYTNADNKSTKEQRKSFLEKLLQYYTYHIDYFKEIKSHLVFEELFK